MSQSAQINLYCTDSYCQGVSCHGAGCHGDADVGAPGMRVSTAHPPSLSLVILHKYVIVFICIRGLVIYTNLLFRVLRIKIRHVIYIGTILPFNLIKHFTTISISRLPVFLVARQAI